MIVSASRYAFAINNALEINPLRVTNGVANISYTLSDIWGSTSSATVTMIFGNPSLAPAKPVKKVSAKPVRRVMLDIGDRSHRVIRAQMRLMIINIYLNNPGIVTIKIKQGNRAISASKKVKVSENGAWLRVSAILPAAKTKPGRYALQALYQGKTSSIPFTIV